MIAERALGLGDSHVSYGGGEKPKYGALRRSIEGFLGDLLRPLALLQGDGAFAVSADVTRSVA